MRTEELIVELARANRPWTPLAPVRVRVLRWILLTLGLCVVVIALVGPRRDLAAALQTPMYLALGAAMLTSGLLAALSAMRLSIPGAEQTPGWRLLSIALAVGWGLVVAGLLVRGEDSWARLAALPNHWACVEEIAGLSLVSGIVLFVMLRRGAPLRAGWCAALAMLAAAAIAAAAAHVMCPVDDPAHQLVSHVLPVALLVAIGTAAGQSGLKLRIKNVEHL